MNRLLVPLFTLSLAATGAMAQSSLPSAAPGAVMPGPGSTATAGISEMQRMLLNEKLELVDRIMKAAGADQQGLQVSADQQRWMLQSLYARPVEELRTMVPTGDLKATIGEIQRANVKAGKPGAKLGQSNTELVYYPIEPCRFIDSRVTGTKIGSADGNSNSLQVDLDQTGAFYGGSAGCNPSAIVGGNANVIAAIAMNVTIVDTTLAPGFMGARPSGSTNLTSMVNWYQAGSFVQAANAGIVTTNQATGLNEIEFFGITAHLVVDVLGVFAAPTVTALDCVTGVLTNVNVSTVSRNFNLTAGSCPSNYRMMSNSCQALGTDPTNVRLTSHGVISALNSNCQGVYEGASNATVTNTPWCCRIPGR